MTTELRTNRKAADNEKDYTKISKNETANSLCIPHSIRLVRCQFRALFSYLSSQTMLIDSID